MSKKEVLMTQEETEVMQATGVPAQEIDGVGVVMATEIIADLKKQLEEAKEEAKDWEESWNVCREQVRALSRQSDINNVIHVSKTVSWKEGGGIEETLPKSDTSKRDIPMNDTIKKVLQMQRTKMSLVYGEIYARKMDNNVFIGSNGAKAVASATVSFSINSVLKRLRQQGIEIERFTHHAFRDTFATRYIEEGGNMQTLQKILGHSSLAMTADLYTHVLPNTKQQEMKQIENGFSEVAVL